MAKKGKGRKTSPKGDDWKDDQYTRHESLEAKMQGIKVKDVSRGEHQQSTPPKKKEEEIPTIVNAYEARRKQGPGFSQGVVE